MKEILMDLIDCQPGDKISREVIDIRTGSVLCSPGHVLTEENIEWMHKFLCSDIYIEKNTWEHVWAITPEVRNAYEENKSKVSDIFTSLKETERLDVENMNVIESYFKETLNSSITIMGCVNIVKGLDEYIYAHSVNVGMLSVLIGRWMNLGEKELEDLFLAGLLHDAGKHKVPHHIIDKKGPLTAQEYKWAQKHVIYGYDLLKDATEITAQVKVGLLTHHERMDGSGYPRGLKGNEIPMFGKIIGVADVYDAMISEKVYRHRQTPFDVMEAMMQQEVGRLDTEILLTFLKNVASFYVGCYVKLSTGQVGEIVFIHPHCVYRPIVKVDEQYIDLDTQKSVRILELV